MALKPDPENSQELPGSGMLIKKLLAGVLPCTRRAGLLLTHKE
jgi:hypothetical protein